MHTHIGPPDQDPEEVYDVRPLWCLDMNLFISLPYKLDFNSEALYYMNSAPLHIEAAHSSVANSLVLVCIASTYASANYELC